MSNKTNSKKIKIIQMKDIVSLLLVFVMLFCSFTYTYAAVILNRNKNVLVYTNDVGGGGSSSGNSSTVKTTTVTANNLLEFNHILNSIYDGAKNKTYSVTKSLNLNKLIFKKEVLPDQNHSLSKQGWKIANYVTVNTMPEISGDGKFPMTVGTFIKEDSSNINLVITYKATTTGEGWDAMMNGKLFNENWQQNIIDLIKNNKLNTGNWGTNIVAILLGFTGAEDEAQQYALNVAKNYANKGKKVNIYVTGHSLGGYLAQIGGSKLLQNATYKNLVKQIGYFNGFGLYVNNIFYKILSGIKEIKPILETFIKEKMYDNAFTMPEVYSMIQEAYQTLEKNKSKVTLYRIRGDWASPLGHHAGQIKEFYPNTTKISAKQGGNNREIAKTTLKVLYVIGLFKMDCSMYPELYNIFDVDKYMAAVHEIDAYNGWNLETEKRVVNIKSMYFSSIPNMIRKNNQTTITLTIELSNAELKEKIDKNDIKVPKNVEITAINQSKETYQLDGNKSYKYLISITIKAKKLVLLPTIILKADVFKLSPPEEFNLTIKNEQLKANYLTVKL